MCIMGSAASESIMEARALARLDSAAGRGLALRNALTPWLIEY